MLSADMLNLHAWLSSVSGIVLFVPVICASSMDYGLIRLLIIAAEGAIFYEHRLGDDYLANTN